MARVSWFSEDGDDLAFDRYVSRMESWQAAMADDVITAGELQAQAQRVTDLLRSLEQQVDDQLHEQLTTVFLEWAVLQGMQAALIMQESSAPASV